MINWRDKQNIGNKMTLEIVKKDEIFLVRNMHASDWTPYSEICVINIWLHPL